MMGTQKLFLIKTHFVILSKKMVSFIMVSWVSFYSSMFTLFGFIGLHIFRLQGKLMGSKSMIKEQEECYTPKCVIEQGDDDEELESLLRFRFPTFEEFVRNNDVCLIGDQVLFDNLDDNCPPAENMEDTLIPQNNMVLKSVDEVVEPRISSDINMLAKPVEEMVEHRISSENQIEMIAKPVKDIEGCSTDLVNVQVDSNETEIENSGEPSQFFDNLGNNVCNVRHDSRFLSDDESLVSDSDSDSMGSSHSSFRGSFIDSLSDGFLSDIDFQKAFEIDTLIDYDCKEVKLSSTFLTKDDLELQNLSKVYGGSDDFKDEDEDILQELKEIEHDLDDNFISLNIEDGLHGEHKKFELNLVDDLEGETSKMDDNGLESNKSSEKSSSDSEEQNGLEREWEHQDLVEQLKMEIKNVRAIGLPTILEESESPKIMEDLKPWKIEKKYHHEGTLDELHKFYKSYRDRMRKLDILNFQKMYAIGFLRLKDPLQSFTKNKISIPALSAIVSFGCWPCKPKSSASEIHKPLMEKFSKELESDLETVYVGQMCLSWEFLCWEYGKALELWESDPRGLRCYNQVAEKFQMFQVLLTRFLEQESFEGPRVQHYVKTRCLLRNLLQVPVVRDDNYRDRKKEGKAISSKDGITSLQLVEIIEESIRILWQFIRTDKNSSKVTIVKYRRSSNIELQSPADASLLSEVQSILQEKHKKLKEITRTQNCILRNIQRHKKEESSDNVLYFFSRVDMTLVTRVLNMPKISTEQLVWCSHKLNNINFVGRKLQVAEPSFLLFPCS
ncbi:hypothetical protein RND81_08G098900 [Saponaria officinalis]|uniref:Ribosomal protein L34Ae n=1 Tax=Saponaria officinalis TaxID=3572 RepID=A0AAW1J6Z0_SAPOF